ncbi:MAG: hypothetical protein HY909_08645 [Deltaproteobacteria bacterium]|nr:hypothetical protein [Deltaproteobacteria bacterium]
MTQDHALRIPELATALSRCVEEVRTSPYPNGIDFRAIDVIDVIGRSAVTDPELAREIERLVLRQPELILELVPVFDAFELELYKRLRQVWESGYELGDALRWRSILEHFHDLLLRPLGLARDLSDIDRLLAARAHGESSGPTVWPTGIPRHHWWWQWPSPVDGYGIAMQYPPDLPRKEDLPLDLP